jgi:uncharacterized protein DUF4231
MSMAQIFDKPEPSPQEHNALHGQQHRQQGERKHYSEFTIRTPKFETDDDDPPYVKKQLQPYINFFDKRYRQERRRECWLVYSIIGFSALIAVVNVFAVGGQSSSGSNSSDILPLVAIISSIFGTLVTILTGISQFEKYHQRWIQSKQVADRLRYHYWCWKNQTGQYMPNCKENSDIQQLIDQMEKELRQLQQKANDEQERQEITIDPRLSLLVQNCEKIILKEELDYTHVFSDEIQNSGNGVNHK